MTHAAALCRRVRRGVLEALARADAAARRQRVRLRGDRAVHPRLRVVVAGAQEGAQHPAGAARD